MASDYCIGLNRLHNISIITESSTEQCQPRRSQGLHPQWFNLQGIHYSVVSKIKLNYMFKENTLKLSDHKVWLELRNDLPFHHNLCPRLLYKKMFQRQCFLIAYLALLNILSILLLRSRSLIKVKIHASYSLLFTQHSSFTQKGRMEGNQWLAILKIQMAWFLLNFCNSSSKSTFLSFPREVDAN